MARKARIKSEFGIFHIQQTGGGCRPLFETREDRQKFLDILTANQRKFNFLLHGYCMAESDRYDIILDVNGGDLSKIMKSINIAFAMYVKSESRLFHDRFKSVLIESEDMLIEVKKEMNSRKDVMKELEPGDSCFFQNFTEVGKSSLADLKLEECNRCIQCIETAKDQLEEIVRDKGITMNTILEDKEIRNQLIVEFRKVSTLSLKSIGELFDGLSESSVSKIIKSTSN